MRTFIVAVMMAALIALGPGQAPVPTTQAASFFWADRFGGTMSDTVSAATVDGAGNVYLAATFCGTADFDPGAGALNLTSAGERDAVVVRLDPNGGLVWARQFGSTDLDAAVSVAVDGSGNVYLSGVFRGTVDFDP